MFLQKQRQHHAPTEQHLDIPYVQMYAATDAPAFAAINQVVISKRHSMDTAINLSKQASQLQVPDDHLLLQCQAPHRAASLRHDKSG
jgi:hypothetical protein